VFLSGVCRACDENAEHALPDGESGVAASVIFMSYVCDADAGVGVGTGEVIVLVVGLPALTPRAGAEAMNVPMSMS